MEAEETSHMRRNGSEEEERPSATPGILTGESTAAPRRRVSASFLYVRTTGPELRSDFSQAFVCIFIF